MLADLATRGAFPSDTNLLVDACIARVREAARLDEYNVLPATLPPLPPVAPRREVMMMALAPTVPVDISRRAETQLVVRPTAKAKATSSRWPMLLCGFVAGAAACGALLASPVGHRPAVQRVTSSVTQFSRTQANHAMHAVSSFTLR